MVAVRAIRGATRCAHVAARSTYSFPGQYIESTLQSLTVESRISSTSKESSAAEVSPSKDMSFKKKEDMDAVSDPDLTIHFEEDLGEEDEK